MSFRELVPGAVYDEDAETLQSVVTSGVGLNEPIDGVTPLCLAARLGRLAVVKYLLDTAKVRSIVDVELNNFITTTWYQSSAEQAGSHIQIKTHLYRHELSAVLKSISRLSATYAHMTLTEGEK